MNEEIPMIMEREFGMPENVPAVLVGFSLNAQQNEEKTAAAGRAVFDDREFVKIMVPGDKHSIVFQPATDRHKQRFPKAWEAFERQNAVALSGTPLEHWPMLTRAQALNFKAANIPTVEALAEISDTNLERLGQDARMWREKARAFLAAATSTAAEQKQAAENQQLRDLVALMQGQVKDLADRLEAATGERPAIELKPAGKKPKKAKKPAAKKRH